MTHAHDSHEHAHSHGHEHGTSAGGPVFAIAVALNVAFVVVEVVYGLMANSLALLSDAGHNLSDVFALLIAWGAMHLGKAQPTTRHTYGYRRSSILAALVNAFTLLIVVGGITWEAAGRLAHPEEVAGTTIIWVAAAGIVINAICAWLFMSGREHDVNIRGVFLHMAGDAAVSVGVVGVGVAILMTGWTWLDPAISILIGAVIVWGTWGVLRESVNLAMDAVPEHIDPHAVEAYIGALPGVQAVHDLHIWAMSTTEAALTVHLVMPRPPADDEFLSGICAELKRRFEIGHATIQIEQGSTACAQAPENVV